MSARRWRWGDPLDEILATLEAGGIVAIPTESSYALAVDPRDTAGVEAVVSLKGREANKPLPVVASGREQLQALEVLPGQPALALTRFWPAPLSIVLETARPWPAAAGASSLAIRVPPHARLRGLLAALDRPLTATSANDSGAPPLLDPEAVVALLAGRRSVLVDDGPLRGGLPSTIVDVRLDGAVRVLRRGAFDPDALPRTISAASVENPVEGEAGRRISRGAERNA